MTAAHFATTRIRDARGGGELMRVQPGEYFVTGDPDEVIMTVLGSCVAACIRDPRTGLGGMNHFMLPQSDAGEWGGASAVMRYGNHAMETLLNAILRTGCRRQDLEIKLFGGANMYEGNNAVGSKNARFAIDYIQNEGLCLSATDLGGRHGRRIHYHPATGKVRRLLLTDRQDTSLTREEQRYSTRMHAAKVEGNIELFS